MDNRAHILMVDDDEALAPLLRAYLEKHGFFLEFRTSGADLEKHLETEKPDVLVLDVMLPGRTGLELCRELRRSQPDLPILMLSARGEVADKVVGLELGADDYLAKPFEPRELVARLQSLIRRASRGPTEAPSAKKRGKFSADGLELDPAARSVHVDGKAVDLSAGEFDLLELFLSRPNEVLDRDTLLAALPGAHWDTFSRSVDVAVSRLRQKLGDATKQPRYLKTIWGRGYRFLPQVKKHEE